MSSLRRKFSLTVILLAWFCTTGSQWDLVQMFAWGRMFVANTAVLSWSDALRRTFTPDARCEICGVVDAAKQTPDDAPAAGTKTDKKPCLICESAPAVFVASPPPVVWPAGPPLSEGITRQRPPLPPPKAA